MNNKYYEYIEAFRNLDIEDKQNEIIKNMKELTDFLSDNEETTNLFEIKTYNNHEEFIDDLFPYLIYLKELIGNKYN